MENPTFKLEGIVKTKEDYEDFEGPLALILQLLSKNKIEIKDIQISLILDQYLAYLEEMKSMDLEVASEFVAMASHLLYIKTKTLLVSDEEENTELEDLISSLENLKCKETYQRLSGVKELLGEMYKRGGGIFTKQPEYIPDKEYRYVHEKEDIFNAISRVLSREDGTQLTIDRKRQFVMPQRIVYPVTDKEEEIMKRLHMSGSLRIDIFLYECKSRTEVVATFIALLELCKTGKIVFSGSDDNFMVTKNNEPAENTESEE